jgi:KDO2-lipid IV(A) lauroyltransferase
MKSDSLVVGAYFTGWKLVRALPEKFAYSLFDQLGKIVLSRNGASMKRLRSNLERVAPHKNVEEMNLLMSEAVSSYMRYWCDTFRSPDWSKSRIATTVTVTREDLLTGPM